MRVSRRRPPLPLAPLLHAYRHGGPPTLDQLRRLAGFGQRLEAILSAREGLLAAGFLDAASSEEFRRALLSYYTACVQPPLHAETLCRRAELVRHGITHVLRGREPLEVKVHNVVDVDGAYFVAGVGASFWSAILQGLDPLHQFAWTPAAAAGLVRLGLLTDRSSPFPQLAQAWTLLQAAAPDLSAPQIEHFLTLVAGMHGRDIREAAQSCDLGGPAREVAPAVARVRSRVSLRRRLKERGAELAQARELFQQALEQQDVLRLARALSLADPVGARRARLRWPAHGEAILAMAGALWHAEDLHEAVGRSHRAESIQRAGLWLPAAVLHVRDPIQFAIWNDIVRRGLARLDEADGEDVPATERYRLHNEAVAYLAREHALHPFEAADMLAELASLPAESENRPPARFGGDSFRFLTELGDNNCRLWIDGQRERYRFAVREPLVELCRSLAERYVRPVLEGEHGWQLETTARSGRALTSICKNDYGRSAPYHTELWITFYPRRTAEAAREGDVQLFVRLDRDGLACGVRIGPAGRGALETLRRNTANHGDLLWRALRHGGASEGCRFTDADGNAATAPADAAGLSAWAEGKSVSASYRFTHDSESVRDGSLTGAVVLAFEKLLPVFACAVETDAGDWLRRRLGDDAEVDGFTAEDFCRQTLLGADWLERATGLLRLKQQLILQGVPGTGKTHVARALARYLARGRDECVRLVQLHPAYSYEEFVEGIKVRTVEANGRSDVTYPVEDGLLCTFAAAAAAHPDRPHVLVVDEINRGNLPRIFGELLYLLEYRGQALVLPYSRREFRLPSNLYLIGTMNAADRSVTVVDQALRRRFSFLDMAPASAVLAAWLEHHPPAAGADFAATVVRLFERLNARLGADLGTAYQFGHSYFMVPDLDERRLRVVWRHHVQPLLDEYFSLSPQKAGGYDLDALLGTGSSRRRRAGKVTS